MGQITSFPIETKDLADATSSSTASQLLAVENGTVKKINASNLSAITSVASDVTALQGKFPNNTGIRIYYVSISGGNQRSLSVSASDLACRGFIGIMSASANGRGIYGFYKTTSGNFSAIPFESLNSTSSYISFIGDATSLTIQNTNTSAVYLYMCWAGDDITVSAQSVIA